MIYILFVTADNFIHAQAASDDNRIQSVINLYEQTLNNNDSDGLLKLFTEDGIVMLQNAPTIIGTEAVGKFYTSLFKTIDIDLKFKIDEVVQVSPEWAFVRTTSFGSTTILSNNSNNLSEGHELFILKKQFDGDWKIARYAASSAK